MQSSDVLAASNGAADSRALATAIRRDVLRMTATGRSSHVGSGLSCADILAVLYAAVMRVDPSNSAWPDRDRFVMSKGHAGAAVYAALAETGFLDRDVLDSHYQNGSHLSGHVSHVGVPGVELSTGSLGHGLSVGAGMAWRAKQSGGSWRVFVLQSDGECDEGSVWEAALFAAHHQLGNLTTIVDYNKLQSLSSTQETLALEPFADKWLSFGWNVVEVDGHDHAALTEAMPTRRDDSKPRVVLAHTTKGKGVPFMENAVLWHYRAPSPEELDRALQYLEQE